MPVNGAAASGGSRNMLNKSDYASYQTTEIEPLNAITDSPVIDWQIPASGINSYIDLKKTTINLTCQLLNKEGIMHSELLTKAGDFVVVPQILYALFKQARLYYGNELIENKFDVDYFSYVYSLLTKSQRYFDTLGATAGWQLNDYDDGDHKPQVRRAGLFWKEFELQGPLSLFSIFNSNDFFPSKLPLHVTLTKNIDPKFYFELMGKRTDAVGETLATPLWGKGYSIKIVKARLNVFYQEMHDNVAGKHKLLNAQGSYIYNFMQTEIRTFHVAKDTSNITQLGLSTGNLPSFLCLGFISEKTYRGDEFMSPYLFQNFALSNSHLQVNGSNSRIPGISPGYRNMSQYVSFMRNMGFFQGDNIDNAITLERFNEGYSFQTFNLANDASSFLSNMGTEQLVPGTITYNATFTRNLQENIVGICLLMYPNAKIRFQKDGSLIKNYIV
jgi:hypothetical protein